MEHLHLSLTTPDDWQKDSVGHLIVEQSKSPIKVSDAACFGSYPFFTSGEDVLAHTEALVKGYNIYIATGGQANIKHYEGDAAYSTDTYVVKTTEDIDTTLLYYYLTHIRYYIDSNYFQGSGLKHLQKKDFKKHEFCFPKDKDEQKRIAALLTKTDAVIADTKSLIEKYRNIKSGLMKDLLTKGIDENGNYRSEETHKFKDSELGRIPEEWELVKLFEIGSDNYLKTGPFGSSLKTEHWRDVGVPVITIGSLGNSDFIKENLLYISQEKATELSSYQMQVGDILFSRVADVGRALVIKEVNEGWIMSSNFMRLRLDQNKIIPQFIYNYILFHTGFIRQINQLVNSSGRSVTNSQILNSLYFLKVPNSEQADICDRIDKIESLILSEECNFKKLNEIRVGLLKDLLSGNIRIPPTIIL